MNSYCDQCERRDNQIRDLQERLAAERRISDGCRADASRLGERIQELEGQREYLRPDLMKHFNEYRSLFGPAPLSDGYGEKWLIEKLLSAGALLERERQQREKLEYKLALAEHLFPATMKEVEAEMVKRAPEKPQQESEER